MEGHDKGGWGALVGKILRCAQDDKRGGGKGEGDKGGDGEVSTVVGAHRSVFRSLPGGVIARGTPRRCGGRVFRQSRH